LLPVGGVDGEVSETEPMNVNPTLNTLDICVLCAVFFAAFAVKSFSAGDYVESFAAVE